MAPRQEFLGRAARLNEALARHGHTAGFVFSDEHYDGDVPYLGGNTNVSIEQVAGVIGPTGFHIVAGLEGGYVAEQLAPRSGAAVHKVELLQLADEKYPIHAERLEDVIAAAAGKPVDHIALLTPRQVIPAALVEYLEELYGREDVVDAQELYYRIKYEKSDVEMRLIGDAGVIADAMLRAMLAVLRPGMLETEVAAWGAWVGRMLGSEEDGFEIMVGANEANRTLIGKALNRPIGEGDWVHLGVAPKRDGLNACIRRSVIAVNHHPQVTAEQRFWFDLVEEAYHVGEEAYRKVAAGEPARALAGAGAGGLLRRPVGRSLTPRGPAHRPGAPEALHRHAQRRLHRVPGVLRRHHARKPTSRSAARSSPCSTWPCAASATTGTTWSSPASTTAWSRTRSASSATKVERLTRLPVNVQHLM